MATRNTYWITTAYIVNEPYLSLVLNESLDIIRICGIPIFKLAYLHVHEDSLELNVLVKYP